MSRPRTPDQFPRMKVRGGRRRHDASFREAWRGVGTAAAGLGAAFVEMRVRAGEFVFTMQAVRAALRASFWLARRRARDQWISRRMLPATPSPWAAPIWKDTR
ncbi:hypothetical protein HUN59_14725 [Curtobacterium sp. Csp2]|uniref:hypothetical protein n=1 Tax=Curtobacterium sp. Csp2 TaxID=2495430 RepID=UPI001580FBF8|nr:hypothetical protein [Curtobacterium sp. Csp2]QKS17295.1 hypothetical protein HUN59_14725 [Curtobacterium sp. Csp2]